MKEAGLTHGGFYTHFESRDALLVEALEQAGRRSRELPSVSRVARETLLQQYDHVAIGST
jgi:AcrR family transcriptional regulator